MKTLAIKKNFNKISLDFHGVINKDPALFKKLSEEFIRIGFEVHIVSGGPSDYIREYLLTHKIPYNSIWCIFDYYKEKGKITVFADGGFHIDDELWDKAKAAYCSRHNICLHIDDSPVYGKYFTTPYCLYNTKTQSGKIKTHLIDFSASAEKTAAEILSVLDSLNNAAGASHH